MKTVKESALPWEPLGAITESARSMRKSLKHNSAIKQAMREKDESVRGGLRHWRLAVFFGVRHSSLFPMLREKIACNVVANIAMREFFNADNEQRVIRYLLTFVRMCAMTWPRPGLYPGLWRLKSLSGPLLPSRVR